MATPRNRKRQDQSAARTPLAAVLGTETKVRIIRALAETRSPIGLADLARNIKMDKSGVWRAAGTLEQSGVIESVGIGSQVRLQLRKAYPLHRHLVGLFLAERVRFEKLLEGLREVGKNLHPVPRAIWIEGGVARGTDQPGDPIIVGFVAPSAESGKLGEALAQRVVPIERRYDVSVEIRSLTMADLAVLGSAEKASLDEVILLLGVPPLSLAGGISRSTSGDSGKDVSHRYRDEQSLALGRAIASRIGRDPTIIRRVRRFLRKRLAVASRREAKELEEWDRILQTFSTSRVQKLLTDNGERAKRLRQSSPFMPALSTAERSDIMKEVGARRLLGPP
jgi:DNA-binding transcriptional ArsR family regulator